MVLGRPFAHIPSRFAEDSHRGHHVNAIDLGEIRTGHAKQIGAQVELRPIPFLHREPPLPRLFR